MFLDLIKEKPGIALLSGFQLVQSMVWKDSNAFVTRMIVRQAPPLCLVSVIGESDTGKDLVF